MLSLRLKTRGAVGAFVAALLMLAGVMSLGYRNTQSLIEATRSSRHTEQVIAEIHATLACAADAETGSRGFVVTGDERFLRPNASLRKDIEEHLDRLRALTLDAPRQQARIEQLTPLARAKFDWIAHVIRVRREQGGEAAAAQVASLQGKKIMDGIREQIAAMEDEEVRVHAERERRVESRVDRANLLLFAGTAVSFGVLLTVFVALLRQIRERSRAESDAESARTFLDSIVETIPHMVFVKDAETLSFVRLNKAAERLLGLRREQLIGKSDLDFFPAEQARFFRDKDRLVLEGKKQIDIPEEPLATESQGTRLLHTTKVPILDAAGRARYLLGISEDITEAKERQREIDRLNQMVLSQVAQLESAVHELEAFSYSVSHDLRAPLRHITGFAELLAEHPSSDPDAQRYLRKISESATRMGALIEDLLVFSRMGRKEMQRSGVPLGPLVQRVIEESKEETAGRRIEWRVEDLPEVRGDPAMLQQVLTNLISNAIKYTAPRELARIEVGALEDTNGDTVIFVRDNGVGFDAQYGHKLFGVFQRLHTNQEFQGTGIGLANVRRIVDRHGGRTWAEGTVGGGATFYFSLPPRKEVFDDAYLEAGAPRR